MKVKLLINIALLLVVLILASLFAEMVVRVLDPQELNPDILQNSEKFRFELKPSYEGKHFVPDQFEVTYSTTEDGFRDDLEENSIFVLGDSFTFGHGVEVYETYPEVLSKLLDEPVSNTGVFGWDTGQQYLLLDDIEEYNPKKVILGFYVGNDIIGNFNDPLVDENLERNNNTFTDSKLRSTAEKIPYYTYLKEKSHLFSIVRFALFKILSGSEERVTISEIYEEENEELWEPTLSLLEAFNDRTDLTVVIIPHREQVKGNFSSLPQETLIEFFDEEGIDYIDLLPELDEDNYYTVDNHWNPSGHLVAAASIASHLE